MFGIGLPEMILIMALALIVVGPDKLPELARSLAKGLMELKNTAEGLKKSFQEEGNPLDDIKPDLEEAAQSLKNNLLDTSIYNENENNDSQLIEADNVLSPAENTEAAYQEIMKNSGIDSTLSESEIASPEDTEPLSPQPPTIKIVTQEKIVEKKKMEREVKE